MKLAVNPTCLGVMLFLIFNTAKAQEITVFQGFWGMEYYQDDQKITKEELKGLFDKNEEVGTYWKKSGKNSTLAYASVGGQFAFAVWALSEWDEDDASGALAPALGSLGFGVLAAIFLNSANKNAKKAILTYNKQFDDKATFRIEPVGNRHGFGLALKW